MVKEKEHNELLVAEKACSSLRETLYLVSIPGMAASIIEGLATPVGQCDDKIDWC
jgi:hypothetical protein